MGRNLKSVPGSEAAGKGFGEWEAGCLFQRMIGRRGWLPGLPPQMSIPELLEKPVPSTTIGSRSRKVGGRIFLSPTLSLFPLFSLPDQELDFFFS